MEDIRKQVETMIGDTPKHLGLVVSLDDIDKDALSNWEKEEFNEITSDLKKVGIELKIDSGHLVLGYHKGKEGIINWNDYPIRVPEEKERKVEQEMNKAEILNQDKEFKYKLLDRMRSDCEYYLGYGNKDAKYLWAGNAKEQIETMRAIYNSFPQNEKPEWITLEQIDGFEKKMVEERRMADRNMKEIITYEKDDRSEEVKKLQFDFKVNMEVIEDLEKMEKTDEVKEALKEAYAEQKRLESREVELLWSEKYELTGETKVVHNETENKDYTLHRIVSLKDFELSNGTKISKGDLGGFVESVYNLSQNGNCWIDGDEHYSAFVYGEAKVSDNAFVSWASISGEAKVSDNAKVHGAEIYGYARISGNAEISQTNGFGDGKTIICDTAEVRDNAKVFDSRLDGSTVVKGNEKIKNQHIHDNINQKKRDTKSQEQPKDKKARTRRKAKSR